MQQTADEMAELQIGIIEKNNCFWKHESGV